MAKLSMRRGNGGQESRFPLLEWDPFRRMRELTSWDPFAEVSAMTSQPSGYWPAFDVRETESAIVIRADLPGIKQEDLDITLTGDRLTIRGKRELEQEVKGDTYYVYERGYGNFTRSFTLPQGVRADEASADLKDGVLSLVVPKRPEAQAKTIPVTAGGRVRA
jgi:HSP20 family protein